MVPFPCQGEGTEPHPGPEGTSITNTHSFAGSWPPASREGTRLLVPHRFRDGDFLFEDAADSGDAWMGKLGMQCNLQPCGNKEGIAFLKRQCLRVERIQGAVPIHHA